MPYIWTNPYVVLPAMAVLAGLAGGLWSSISTDRRINARLKKEGLIK